MAFLGLGLTSKCMWLLGRIWFLAVAGLRCPLPWCQEAIISPQRPLWLLARSSHDLRQGSHNTAAYVFKASRRISLSFAERESYVTCHHQGVTVAYSVLCSDQRRYSPITFVGFCWLETSYRSCWHSRGGDHTKAGLTGATLKFCPPQRLPSFTMQSAPPPPLFLKFMFPTSLLVPRTFPAHCHPHPWHGYHGCDLCTWRHVYIVKYLAWFQCECVFNL